jgi:hypothetical protein
VDGHTTTTDGEATLDDLGDTTGEILAEEVRNWGV